jgi:hypothetical protein
MTLAATCAALHYAGLDVAALAEIAQRLGFGRGTGAVRELPWGIPIEE